MTIPASSGAKAADLPQHLHGTRAAIFHLLRKAGPSPSSGRMSAQSQTAPPPRAARVPHVAAGTSARFKPTAPRVREAPQSTGPKAAPAAAMSPALKALKRQLRLVSEADPRATAPDTVPRDGAAHFFSEDHFEFLSLEARAAALESENTHRREQVAAS
ncbi:MAG: hypothetical protein AAGA70_15830 [Pseudomonadota bacterium]